MGCKAGSAAGGGHHQDCGPATASRPQLLLFLLPRGSFCGCLRFFSNLHFLPSFFSLSFLKRKWKLVNCVYVCVVAEGWRPWGCHVLYKEDYGDVWTQRVNLLRFCLTCVSNASHPNKKNGRIAVGVSNLSNYYKLYPNFLFLQLGFQTFHLYCSWRTCRRNLSI